jgi:hypothetical protein
VDLIDGQRAKWAERGVDLRRRLIIGCQFEYMFRALDADPR